MKSQRIMYSLASMLAVSSCAFADTVTLWQFASPEDGVAASDFPTTSVWVEPIGTGSGGGETTYILNKVDQAEPTGTDTAATGLTTDAVTVVASASGIRFSETDLQAFCSLTAANNGDCVYVGPVTGTEMVTVTETGLTAIPFAVAVSTSGVAAPIQTGASGAASGSGSGSASSASASPSNSASGLVISGKAAAGVMVVVGVVGGLML